MTGARRPRVERLSDGKIFVAHAATCVELVLRSRALHVRTRRHEVGLGAAVLDRTVARKENNVLGVVGVLHSHTATIGFGPSHILADANGYDVLRRSRYRYRRAVDIAVVPGREQDRHTLISWGVGICVTHQRVEHLGIVAVVIAEIRRAPAPAIVRQAGTRAIGI